MSSRIKQIDYYILIPYLLLCAIGIIMVFSASSNVAAQNGTTPISYLIRQALFVVIGFGITYFMTSINITILKSPVVMGLGYLGVMVLLFGLLFFGQTVNGAAGWIRIGPINIQPAEIAKFILIIINAFFITRSNRETRLLNGEWWRTMRQPLIMSALIILLVFFQPDMGGATIIAAICFMMWLASGIPWRRSFRILVVTVAFIVCILFPIAVKLSESGAIKSYKLARVLAFVDPFGHASSAGAQLVNSYYALSNGGLFGVGLGNSIQKRGYLPEPNTDFIMAIVGEELGLVGIVVILILLAIIIGRAVQLGIRSTNGYYALLCYGIATYFTVQAVINVGGVAGVLPITGVTFPFISYGGSSMFSLTLALGTLLNISTRERKERNHDV
ncbi:cell division protein FtsW [Secundilactobacillus kimchicus]|nr:FtsW/RodA/SpoVE family cell cycle protein [Secundilactobacillus kimchicus]MBT9673045.1 cell division protein FtsW [Secundilactobacillus kimchicus]